MLFRSQGVDLAQNSAITIIQGVDATQNVQIQGIQGVDLAQNSAISIIQGTDLTQNTWITSNVAYFQGIENTQNTNIIAVNQFAQSAYNQANTPWSYLQNGANTNQLIWTNGGSLNFPDGTGYRLGLWQTINSNPYRINVKQSTVPLITNQLEIRSEEHTSELQSH